MIEDLLADSVPLEERKVSAYKWDNPLLVRGDPSWAVEQMRNGRAVRIATHGDPTFIGVCYRYQLLGGIQISHNYGVTWISSVAPTFRDWVDRWSRHLPVSFEVI